MTTFPDEMLSPAEKRFEKTQARTATSLTSWRTPARRRILVRLNWTCIAVMAVIAVVSYFWLPVAIAWLPMTAAICTVWTMLRVTIDCRDTAPARYLDELEIATLLHARSQALTVVTAILFVIAMVLIAGSSLELGNGHRLAYAMGGLAILTIFVAGVIPAAAMAGTMPADDLVDD